MRTLLIAINLLIASLCVAQQREAYGLLGAYSFNIHSADFQKLLGVPSCCPRYETGTGSGIAFGELYQLPLSMIFSAQFRFMYQSLSATLSQTENTTVYHNGIPTTGSFKHSLDATIAIIGFEPLLGIKIVHNIEFHTGLMFASLISKKYSQREEIIQPDGAGTFLDSAGNDSHSRIRNQFSDEIPNASSFQVALIAGISYSIPLNKQETFFFSPEFLYSYSLTTIASTLKWKANSLRIGASVVYSPKRIVVEPER